MKRPPRTTRIIRSGRAPKPTPPWEPTKRQIRLGLLTAGGLALVIITVVAWLSFPHRLTPQERVVISDYDAVRSALANDDLATAHNAGAQLLADARENNRIARAAMSLTQADSLAKARNAFAAISRQVIKLATGNAGYYRIGCSASMANCPAACEPCETLKFSDWIQTSPVVQNPFMGRVHPDCGLVK